MSGSPFRRLGKAIKGAPESAVHLGPFDLLTKCMHERLSAWREPEANVQTVHLNLQQLAVEMLSSLELPCEERLRLVPEQLVSHPTRVAAVLVGQPLG
ncbi:MAG: hypothetical protein FRX49_06222 [Trebouxia sp. A1-2]|nr:MAG: hypothetical protein FRX49_06222 [Trebouxia sp. A1-2]